jgi:hypothetical protein
MPLIRPIQPSFSGGEVSPSIYARIDIERYKSSLRTCRNFIIHPHGGASNRPGTRFVAETKYATTSTATLQEFIFSNEQRYVLEFGDEYVRFYTGGDQVEVTSTDYSSWSNVTAYVEGDYVTYGGSTVYYAISNNTNQQPDISPTYWTQQSIYEVPTPYTESNLSLLKFETSADVIWITHPDFKPRTLTRYANTNWVLEEYDPDDGPFMVENIDDAHTMVASATSGNCSLTSSQVFFANTHVGALMKLKHYIEGQTVSTSLSSSTTSGSITCFTTWRLITHGTWTGKLSIEKSTDNGVTWSTLRTFSSTNDININTSGTEDLEIDTVPFLVRANMISYTSGTCNLDLTTDPFFQEGIMRITEVNSSTFVQCEIIQNLGSTSGTASWYEGSWSDYRGYPSVARFYQDRLCFAGTYYEPMTVWMTQTGNYYSFFRHSTLLDTDGITVNLPSRQVNAINGMVALTELIVLTSASEWSIGPGSTGVLTPTSISVEVQGYRGSNGINPVVIGNEAIYVQRNSRVIRNIGFDFSSDGFTGSELNVLAKHLFSQYEITDIAYQQDPDSIVWCLRNDGALVAMTYMREQEVVAWHKHDTNGDIESICVIPDPDANFDELWMIVNRTNGRFVERMSLRMRGYTCVDGSAGAALQDQIFLDSSVSSGEDFIQISNIDNYDTYIVITTSSNHGFVDGDTIRLEGIVGMESLNGNNYSITYATSTTFTIIL